MVTRIDSRKILLAALTAVAFSCPLYAGLVTPKVEFITVASINNDWIQGNSSLNQLDPVHQIPPIATTNITASSSEKTSLVENQNRQLSTIQTPTDTFKNEEVGRSRDEDKNVSGVIGEFVSLLGINKLIEQTQPDEVTPLVSNVSDSQMGALLTDHPFRRVATEFPQNVDGSSKGRSKKDVDGLSFTVASEGEGDVERSDDVVDPPLIELSAGLMIISEMPEESIEDSDLDEKNDWLSSLIHLDEILGLPAYDRFKQYDAPDTDPVLNALEGVLDLEEETAIAENEDRSEIERKPQGADNTDTPNQIPDIPDIPVYSNKRIEAFIRLYTVKKRDVFETGLRRSAQYMGMIDRIFAEYGLPPNLAYLAVVESNLNPEARSHASAVGLWQFMSYTGKVFDLNRSWWHDDRYDPEKSTIAAAKFLKQLHKRFKGDWELALAAYNSGGGTVRRAIRKAQKSNKPTDYWSLRLPRETRGYVPAFYAVVTIFQNLEKYGFDPAPPRIAETMKKPLAVAGGISLRQIAEVLTLETETLEKLNPSLRMRGLTPATYDRFDIFIPENVAVSEAQSKQLAQLAVDRKEDWKIHKVKQGESLWSISQYYKIPISKIRTFNRLKRKNLINIGQKLMLPVPKSWTAPPVVNQTKVAVAKLNQMPGITYIHVVKKGETLWQISTLYNVRISDIRRWNQTILKRRYLKVGAELVLKLPVKIETST